MGVSAPKNPLETMHQTVKPKWKDYNTETQDRRGGNMCWNKKNLTPTQKNMEEIPTNMETDTTSATTLTRKKRETTTSDS